MRADGRTLLDIAADARRRRSRRCRSGCATSSSSRSPAERPRIAVRTRSTSPSWPRSPSATGSASNASASLSDDAFLAAGAALYAGEGSKSATAVTSPTPIPAMVRVLLRMASSVLRDRRVATACARVPARRARSRRGRAVLVGRHRRSACTVRRVRTEPRPIRRSGKRSTSTDARTSATRCCAHAPRDHGPRPGAAILGGHSGVAQLAERRPVKPIVESSSLSPGAPHRRRIFRRCCHKQRSLGASVPSMDTRGGAAGLTSVDERWGPDDLEALRAQYEPLRRFAAVIGRWDVEPDDLVQEAFAKVLVRQPGADPRPRRVPAPHGREPRDRRAPAVRAGAERGAEDRDRCRGGRRVSERPRRPPRARRRASVRCCTSSRSKVNRSHRPPPRSACRTATRGVALLRARRRLRAELSKESSGE